MPNDHAPSTDDTAHATTDHPPDDARRRPPRTVRSDAAADDGDSRRLDGEDGSESDGEPERPVETETTDEGEATTGTDDGRVDESAVGEQIDPGGPGSVDERIDPEETAIPARPGDEVFELLASPGNRYVLTYLLRANSPAELGELVEYVLDSVGPPAESTPAKFRGRVASQLVHANLPALEAAGLVEYDSDEQVVSARPPVDDVAPYLDLALARATRDREE